LAWLTAYRRLVRDYERDPEVSEEMIRWAAISQMLRRITRGRPAQRQQRRTLQQARTTSPLSRPLSPASLAGEFHVSTRTLQWAFAADGESAAGYIRRRRLEEAGCVLATSGTSISEVAARWHFADSGHFSRTFKKQHGLTPTAYAASARGRREKA
jgi:AraC-like DNA-binding protein